MQLPLTGVGVVSLIVTELGGDRSYARKVWCCCEVAPGVTAEDVQKATEPALKRAPDLKTMAL